jgi:hypothetical protein
MTPKKEKGNTTMNNMIKFELHRKWEVCVYDCIAFVARAMNKADARPYMHGFNKEGKWIVATDGHRLHFANLAECCECDGVNADVFWKNEFPDGFYKIESLTKKEAIISRVENPPFSKFPNWERVLGGDVTRFGKTSYGELMYGLSAPIAEVYKLFAGFDSFINLDYLSDVFKPTRNDGRIKEYWTILVQDELSAVRIKNSYKAAAIMPIKP